MNALVLDIDSTIYEHQSHTISTRLLDQLTRYQKEGYAIVLATSRSQNELAHLPKAFREFDFDYAILNGGALILDSRKNILFESLISPKKLEKLSACLASNKLNWRYVCKEGDFFAHRPAREQRDIMNYFYLQAPPCKPWQQEPLYSLLIWLDEVPQELKELIRDLHSVDYIGALELCAQGISKGHGFDWLRKHSQIDKAVVFGDGDNDLELFERADLSIAPENAREKVKDQADLVCASVYEDGVARFLAQHSPQELDHSLKQERSKP